MRDRTKPETDRNPHHDTGREAAQPYATEHEDYREGPSRPPEERPGVPEGKREEPPPAKPSD